MVRNHELQDYFRFYGHVDNPFPILCQADLFCLTSRYEGMPNALLEAMACRVPVLVTDCPHGPREILEGGKYGRLVPPQDVPSLTAAIANAMDQVQSWQAKVDEAFLHVQRTYSQSSCLERTERMLQEIS